MKQTVVTESKFNQQNEFIKTIDSIKPEEDKVQNEI